MAGRGDSALPYRGRSLGTRVLLAPRGGTLLPMAALRPTTDGVVEIRPPSPGDAEVLIAGRDEVFHRFMGEGSAHPQPTGCIVVGGDVVGWVDHDIDRTWLEAGEVNVGYNVFSPHRGNGYATRAVELLVHHLAVDSDHHTATLLIDPRNHRSLALATRTRFEPWGDLDGNPYFKRAVPPLTYSDGVVTIRPQLAGDLDRDLEAKDDEQIDWLWLPGQRASWEAMTPDEQRAHALGGLQANIAAFGTGPKWTFAVDTADASCVAYVDCDLANDHVPHGEANISYAVHPAHRRQGHVSRAVRLLTRFLADHTGARRAHLVVDAANTASLRVARAVGGRPIARATDETGSLVHRFVLDL